MEDERSPELSLLLNIIGRAVRDFTDGDSLAVRDVTFNVEMEMKHKNLAVVSTEVPEEAPVTASKR